MNPDDIPHRAALEYKRRSQLRWVQADYLMCRRWGFAIIILLVSMLAKL
jgi:hypothetical protein